MGVQNSLLRRCGVQNKEKRVLSVQNKDASVQNIRSRECTDYPHAVYRLTVPVCRLSIVAVRG